MAKTPKTFSRFGGGIADFIKEGIKDSYAFGQSIDVRSDPQSLTLLPRTLKESGTIIQALPKWGEYISACDITYLYDEAGSIYQRDSNAAYSLLHTVPSSHGNGMSWFGEDNYIYYTSDTLIGRYGPMCATTPTFTDDFFGSQGGVPLNTNSLQLLSASTQYASRADTASLSITGSLSVETWIKPTTLPASGATMTLVSKWTENGNVRSYKFGIGTVSNFFGDGSNGALTISVDTTDSPIDSTCSGSSGSYTLTATNASFASGQKIYIMQVQGTNAGSSQINSIQSYTVGIITLTMALNTDYSSSGTNAAQVVVIKQYTDITVNSGKTWTAKAWNGTTGGILPFLANNSLTVTGTISAKGKGFRGATQPSVGSGNGGLQGEGYSTNTYNSASTSNNSNGGGGGAGSAHAAGGGAAGGGYSTAGSVGYPSGDAINAVAGTTVGGQDLTAQVFFGGGGGSGGNSYNSSSDGGRGGPGANGGGLIIGGAPTVTITGGITAGGDSAANGNYAHASGGGGGGAGGAVLIYSQTATLGAGFVTATGGSGGSNTNGYLQTGGVGGQGRNHLDYLTSYTGTSDPTLYATQDPNLGSSSGYTLFLSISSTGTNVETYTKPAGIQTAVWQNVAVAWDQSISTAEFFLNGVSLGTQVGVLTAIVDNASTFNIGMDRDSSSNPQHLYNGLIDEVRLWAGVRTADNIFPQLYQQINSASSGLVGYWQFNAVATDATSNANNLTLTGAPTYSTDVPFPSPTSRADIDQTGTGAGNTYALPTAIAETSADKQTFTPAKDPQKSIQVFVSAKGAGTGSWTLTVHDQYNVVQASATVTKAALSTGLYEFIFPTVWRPLTNFTNSYHFHITDSDGTGTVKTQSSNDLSNSTFTTYFQYLVSDTGFHPVARMLQFLVFGNERYVGKLEATVYDPNAIALPAGYRVRCFGFWREYLVIGAIKGDTITEQDQGRAFFWDGIAETYNFFADCPDGGITALQNYRGELFAWAGYQGTMLRYHKLSYLGGNSFEIEKKMPRILDSENIEIYPQGVTVWKSLVRVGAVGGSSTSTIKKGVYTFGHLQLNYPDIITFDYPVSTGNTTGTNLRIGMLLPVNQKLLIGWQDGTGYGVDNVDSSNLCYPTGYVEFLYDDNQAVWKEKLANTLVVKTATLTTGQSIIPRVRLDDATIWTSGDTTTSTSNDPTLARFVLTNERNYELQYGVDIASTSGVSPTVKGVGFEISDLTEEGRV